MANTSRKSATKREESTPMQTWNVITGTMRVYGNTFEVGKGKNKHNMVKWSATISGKNADDEWVNYYVPVKFAGKDSCEPDSDGLHTIDISNAFWSIDTYENRKGETVTIPCVVVTSNEVVE